jgi:hypothetical protein
LYCGVMACGSMHEFGRQHGVRSKDDGCLFQCRGRRNFWEDGMTCSNTCEWKLSAKTSNLCARCWYKT